jgi:hypothetical protein
MTDRKSRVNDNPKPTPAQWKAVDRLFTLRVSIDPWKPLVVILAFESMAPVPWHNSHTRIDVEVRQGGKVIFPRGVLYCGIPNGQSTDDVFAKEYVLSLVSETDSAYFKGYTPEQLAFANTYGDELGMIREWRYCDENGNVRTSRKRLLDKLAKKGEV